MNPFAVSVVITCYNLGAYLRESVDSVRAQTYPCAELIIVDDGSTEEVTKRVLEELSAEGVIVLCGANQGLPRARNKGIEYATAPFICCLDADDFLSSNYLESCITVFRQDETGRVGIVTTKAKIFGVQERDWTIDPGNLLQHFLENTIHVSSVFRRESWLRLGGYDPALTGYQDWDFWLRIRVSGYECRLAPDGVFWYRDRVGSMVKTSDAKRPLLYQSIIEKHKTYLAERTLELLLTVQQIRTADSLGAATRIEALERAFLAEQSRSEAFEEAYSKEQSRSVAFEEAYHSEQSRCEDALALVRSTEALELSRRRELEVAERELSEWRKLRTLGGLTSAIVKAAWGRGILRHRGHTR